MIVHTLKYEGVKELASFMAHAMSGFWKDNSSLSTLSSATAVFVPIPLHTKKLREREWNQAELIASQLGRMVGISVESGALVRKKNTQPQSSLSREERIVNMKNAFFCAASSISLKNKTVILIDDVMTTGATLNQAALALRLSGVTDIRGFVFARGNQ